MQIHCLIFPLKELVLGFQTKSIKAEDIGNYAFPGDTK